MSATGLDRFVAAQAPVIGAVTGELANGRKETHWMWFVFPQMRTLGRSDTALLYGIEDLAEARAYARHPVLAPRLRACSELVLSHVEQRTATDVMGPVDAQKLRSSMTLFARAAPDAPVFEAVLGAYYDAAPCTRTMELLG